MNHHQYLNEKEGNKNRKDKSKQKKKKKKKSFAKIKEGKKNEHKNIMARYSNWEQYKRYTSESKSTLLNV